MNAADIAFWIWLTPLLLFMVAGMCLVAGAVAVGAYRAWQRVLDMPSSRWARREIMRRWWRSNWLDVSVVCASLAWLVGGFLVVVYLNGASS